MILFLHQENPQYPPDIDGYVRDLLKKCDVFISQPLNNHNAIIVRAPYDAFLHPIYAIGKGYNLYIASYISEPEIYNPNRYL